jgi:hypothetical protein
MIESLEAAKKHREMAIAKFSHDVEMIACYIHQTPSKSDEDTVEEGFKHIFFRAMPESW